MDAGNMQVGLLLSLTEDPPQALFTGRSLCKSSLRRPFAPTASQRWITVALQYLKEMDVIATRRLEVTAPKKGGEQGGGDSQAPTAPAPASKRSQNDPQAEEET